MLPVNCGSHSDYQNFVVTNLRKYYPNPDALARSTWSIIERFWNLEIFTFQSTMPEFSWHGHARFREIIVLIFTGSLSFP